MNLGPAKILRTTAGRTAGRYALGFLLMLLFSLGVVFLLRHFYIHPRVARSLEAEVAQLSSLDRAALIREVERRSQVHATEGELRRRYLLLAPDRTPLAGELLSWPPDMACDGECRNFWASHQVVKDLEGEEPSFWPGAGTTLPDGSRLAVVQGVEFSEELAEVGVPALLFSFLLSIGGALVMGLSLGRTLLGRVEILNATAREVARGDLAQRAPVDGSGDEFDELGRHINGMLDQIEKLLTGMKRVSDNVAHDLRSPISRLLNRLEVTLLEERSPEEYRSSIQQAVGDLDEVMKTFNSLLQIAQTEAGKVRGSWGPVDLSLVMTELAELYAEVSENLQFEVEPGLRVLGDRHLLQQAVSNLLDNALKFAPDGPLKLKASSSDGFCQIEVADRGPGIPADQAQFVCQRFTRLEQARSQPGNGLGLALVKAVADLHKGELALTDHQPGLRVVLKLPEVGALVLG